MTVSKTEDHMVVQLAETAAVEKVLMSGLKTVASMDTRKVVDLVDMSALPLAAQRVHRTVDL